MNRKTISETLYLGLRVAEEDAGGALIAMEWSRQDWGNVMAGIAKVKNGEDQCGCIHGAAVLVDGELDGPTTRALNNVGISWPRFDVWAVPEIAAGRTVTVDRCLRHFGVDVAPDAELETMTAQLVSEDRP